MVPGRRFDGKAWRLGALVCLVVALAVPTLTARAEEVGPPDIPPMRFVVVRSNDPGCEPNCPEWISAEGTIVAGTPSLLKRTLKALKGRQLPVVVNSPGGNVDAALALGRMIRKNKLDTAVGVTIFSGCQPEAKDCSDNNGKGADYFGMAFDDGAMCNSACPLMFSGGLRRVVGDFSYLGVHQITTTFHRERLLYRTTYRIVNGKKKVINTKVVSRKNAGSYKTYEMSKAVENTLSAYLQEMGIGDGVLEIMKATPASDIRQIPLDDMLTMKLVTSGDAVDLLTTASLCRPEQPAANCREIPRPGNKAAPSAAATMASAKSTEAAKAGAEMRFAVVRGSNPLCNPDCPEWISAEGAITPQTPQRLRQLLATLGNRRLPVVISSRGGDLPSALAMGRLIRERKLDIAVARTDFVDCDPAVWNCVAKEGAYAGLSIDAGVECDSACALMLAGGARRFVGPQARLSLYPMGQKQAVKAYLEEMVIGPGLFAAIAGRTAERQLEPEMMLKLGLTTGPQSVDALTGATICKAVPKPDNCRGLPPANAAADAPAKL
ncbi:MAG: hypothetical protein E5V49_16245 [Mesorhizobium sp.]|nr:hypothetical protein EN848_27150 [bacterium M00.F.Ca.ET.205.01.1.1]TGU48105.1 hypothetical protein EN795_28430 [bacterium M00.F.Ca.ET.152.01.1.1]TGV32344.1 hypothetical protein EN829_027975 [Mesorhizobium sp. M00.F.Ca.ET.186.01.1.1]TGZ39556.1 hypothetical protein EN805_27825 [bacterium M00.F.Ca.ET.162.01.1.1]TJW31474.1 MAG: hypothetical protein E5V49_16245 [Mesorhizobium sp.]